MSSGPAGLARSRAQHTAAAEAAAVRSTLLPPRPQLRERLARTTAALQGSCVDGPTPRSGTLVGSCASSSSSWLMMASALKSFTWKGEEGRA